MSSPSAGGQQAALFAEIANKAEKAVSGFHHVTDSEKTYKQEKGEAKAHNFDGLFANKAAAEARRKEKEAAATVHGHAKAPVGPPVFERQINRFVAKNIIGGPDEKQERKSIDDVAINNSVAITNCEHFVLQVPGKFNSLVIMGSRSVAVGVDNIVSNIDISNSNNITVHVSGSIRSVIVDKSTQVTLVFADAETARSVEVMTSVCSSCNVRFADKDDADTLLERPLCEQFVSKVVKDGKGFFKLVTKACDI